MSFEVKITPKKRQQKSHSIERLCKILQNYPALVKVRKSPQITAARLHLLCRLRRGMIFPAEQFLCLKKAQKKAAQRAAWKIMFRE